MGPPQSSSSSSPAGPAPVNAGPHALADVLPAAMPGRGRYRRRSKLRIVRPDPPDRPDRRPDPGYRSGRAVMTELGSDVGYLAIKASLGEPLTAAERTILEAHKAGGGE